MRNQQNGVPVPGTSIQDTDSQDMGEV